MSIDVVRLRIPGTCGEWIQTVSMCKECLVSLPIDRYTEVTARRTTAQSAKQSFESMLPKSQHMVQLTANYLGLERAACSEVAFETNRQLDIGKGMASSTADLVGIAACLAKLFGKSIDSESLFKLCCEVESSDGIMFDRWTLIDHLNGKLLHSYETFLDAEILMLTPNSVVVTEDLRKNASYAVQLGKKTEKPLQLFNEAMAKTSLSLLGAAATQSLIENESILKKAYLEDLIDLCEIYDCYGVVGGHSGTVSGLLINEKRTDKEGLLARLKASPLNIYYTDYQFVKTVRGGIEFLNTEA
jgi:L-threonine kinase